MAWERAVAAGDALPEIQVEAKKPPASKTNQGQQCWLSIERPYLLNPKALEPAPPQEAGG
jgi:hypothetical protein